MSALLLSLGISGGVVLAAVPLIGQVASASVVARDPDPGDVVPPCDAGETCEPTEVVTTVTITTTLPTPTPTPTDPVTTVTTTVTPTQAKKTSKAPEPEKTTPAPTTPPVTQEQPVQPPPVAPTASSVPPPTTAELEPTFSFPAAQDPSTAQDPGTGTPSTEPTDSEQLVVRNAAPEYNQVDLSRKLGIPALVLVLLALFAVLIFEGRLRRLAHAAAVRRAGPQAPGRHRGDGAPEPYGYPAGPGFAGAVPAYAPIISFVPVQTYPGGPAQYAPVYQQPFPQDPAMYGQQGQTAEYPGYPQHPGQPQTAYTQPAFTEPAYTQPDYSQPGYEQPDYTHAGHQQAGPQDDYAQREHLQHEEPLAERFDAFQPREFHVAGDDPLPSDLMTGHVGREDDVQAYRDGSAEADTAGYRGGLAEGGAAGFLAGPVDGGAADDQDGLVGGAPGYRDDAADSGAGSSGHPAEGREYRDLFEPLVAPDQPPLGDIPPGGDAPFDEPHPGHPVASAPLGVEPSDAEPWQYGAPQYDDAPTYGDAPRYDDASTYGEAPRYGEASQHSDARHYGDAHQHGDVPASGEASPHGDVTPYGDSSRYGDARRDDEVSQDDQTSIVPMREDRDHREF
ncbi:hypothetical protein [Nonomuraea dietziae]|uniref:hypothetical protein n=1 Tax=Nonomuraea dietziae TaxID=65515 RepID=UPI003408DBB0